MSDDQIMHSGIITEINRDSILVSIIAESACAACHAKGFCSVADQKEKIVEVNRDHKTDHKIGERVSVTMQRAMGMKAVLYGYFIPFVILMITLIVSIKVTGKEGVSGLISLLVLIPYFFALYMLRDKLKRNFVFKISKLQSETNLNYN
nr:SoxR reducing system RseC family protein [Bacteroidota bacterium]